MLASNTVRSAMPCGAQLAMEGIFTLPLTGFASTYLMVSSHYNDSHPLQQPPPFTPPLPLSAHTHTHTQTARSMMLCGVTLIHSSNLPPPPPSSHFPKHTHTHTTVRSAMTCRAQLAMEGIFTRPLTGFASNSLMVIWLASTPTSPPPQHTQTQLNLKHFDQLWQGSYLCPV